MHPRHSREFLGQRGVAALEFAFVLPVLLLIAFGIIDFGRAVWTQATIDYAVQYTARWAAIECGSSGANCPNSGAIQTYAANQTIGISIPQPSLIFPGPDTAATCGTGVTGVKVSATYPFTYIFPAFSHYSGLLKASACFPI